MDDRRAPRPAARAHHDAAPCSGTVASILPPAKRAAVIGAGHLGRFHARKYAALPGAELVAVVDTDLGRARELADSLGCGSAERHLDLAGRIDVASIAVPTSAHYRVARDLLEAGVDVLLEKPMAATLEQAQALATLAGQRGRVLQVGHLERFNPVTQALAGRIDRPRFIEAQRVAPFQQRGTDVNVVLDLMIHDIDLILTLVGRPVLRVRADGMRVLSDHVDIANARIEFEGGCVANVTASRVSTCRNRRMRLFQADAYFAADFDARTLEIRYREPGGSFAGIPGIGAEQVRIASTDPLRDEIAAFLEATRRRSTPVVTAADGCRALETALEVTRQIELSTRGPDAAPRSRSRVAGGERR